MTALKAHEVARFLSKPDLREGMFLAYGPDTGLVHETALRLIDRLSHGDPSTIDLLVLDASDLAAAPERLAVETRTGSLFGGTRVIRVRGGTKAIAPVLKDLGDDFGGSAVVIEADNLTPKDPLRAVVEASRSGRALPCYADNAETVAALVRETFREAGIRTEAGVEDTLRDILGNDREITRRELEKLVLFASGTGTLSHADVMTLCADNGALAIDEILDSAGNGDAARADSAVTRALNGGIDPQRILGSAMLHFSALRRWRTQVDQGKSPSDVLDASRPKPHFSRKAALVSQLRTLGDEDLAAACARILQATGESRRRPALAEAVTRRAVLGIAMAAARR